MITVSIYQIWYQFHILTTITWLVIPPFHRGRRVPGHWPQSRFVTSGHGPVSCVSSTDEFRSPSDMCSTSVRLNRWVPIKQNRPMTKVQRVSNSSSDVCSDEISGQWRFTHRLHRTPSANSDYPPATDLPHSHGMLSGHRRQDKSMIRRPLIGSSVGYRKHRTPISGLSAINRRFSWTQVFKTSKSEGARLLLGRCHVCNRNVTGTFGTW